MVFLLNLSASLSENPCLPIEAGKFFSPQNTNAEQYENAKDNTCFTCLEYQKSCEYYANKVGFRLRHQEETFAIAVLDDIEIHLWQSRDNS